MMRLPKRVEFGRRRWHHGAFGCVTLAVGVAQGSPLLVIAGVALIVHDWPDKSRWWVELVRKAAA